MAFQDIQAELGLPYSRRPPPKVHQQTYRPLTCLEFGMISPISVHAPGISKWGWSLLNLLAASSCDRARTIE